MSRLRSSSTASLADKLGELPRLTREQLIELWVEHMGRPPPKAASPSLLARALAYAIQEQQLGGLNGQDGRVLHKTAQAVSRASRATRAASSRYKKGDAEKPESPEIGSQPDAGSEARSRASPASPALTTLRPGTRLVREWQGMSYTVDVRADGFGWNGEVYRSLSAVARAITGARWSGNRFFRL